MSHGSSRARALPLLAIAAAVAAVAGCSGSTSTGVTLTNADLVGSYSLVSISQNGTPALGPPIATGTLVLADSTYEVDVTVNATQPPTVIADTGIFHVNGSSWSQRSTSTPNEPQGTGTVSFSHDTLVVSANSGGVVTNMTWFR